MITTVVFYWRNFIFGGTETLIVRLASWYKRHGIRTVILTSTECTDSNILNLANKLNIVNDLYVFDTHSSKYKNSNEDYLQFKVEEQIVHLSFYLPDYISQKVYFLKTYNSLECNHKLYIVHPNSTHINLQKIPVIGNLILKHLINSLVMNRQLCFMDEECVKEFKLLYSFARSFQFPLYRIPIVINHEPIPEKSGSFNILTISRLEFPFKGYVLGLIRSFSELKQIYPQITLTIIGSGSGRHEINQLLNSQASTVSSSVKLLENTPNDLINNFIEGCDVYVGMGTTVLDAANRSKICIVAKAYQCQDFSSGFFHDNPHTVGEIYRSGEDSPRFSELLKIVLNLNRQPFLELGRLSHKALVKNYNIDEVAENIIADGFSNRNSAVQNFYLNCINVISRFFYKLRALFAERTENI